MTVSISTLDFVFGSVFPHRNTIALKVIVNERWRGFGKYLNSGFDRSSFLKTDNSNEFSSSCTTRIVPILTTGVSFLRSYKVSNKRPIMGHPRSDLGCPRSGLVGPGQSQGGLGLSQASPSVARLVRVCLGLA